MTTRKNLIISVLCTFCLTVSIFSIIPVSSLTRQYDPWYDINDDGTIDLKDYYGVGLRFGATGDPTKTVSVDAYKWNSSSYAINVPAGTSGNLNITTAGYSKITVGFDTNSTQQALDVKPAFLIGNHYQYIDRLNVTSCSPVSHAATSIWIEPSPKNLYQPTVGSKFNVTVWTQVNNLAGVQILMYFNDGILNVTRWFEPTTDSQYIFYGKSTSALPTPPNVYYHHVSTNLGFVESSVCLFPTPPDQPAFSGKGKVCIFEFKVTRKPRIGEPACFLDINNAQTYMLDSNVNEIPSTKYGAFVQWEWNYDVRTYPIAGPLLTIVYDNYSPENMIFRMVTYLTTAGGGQSGVQDVNVFNWPEGQPPTVTKKTQRIKIVESPASGVSIGAGGLVFGAFFLFDFEPAGQLINITDLYAFRIWKSLDGNLYMVRFTINDNLVFYDSIFGDSEYPRAWEDHFVYNPVSGIREGINHLDLFRPDYTPTMDIFLYEFELYIEYYSWS